MALEFAKDSPIRVSASGASASTRAFRRARQTSWWRSVRHPLRMVVMAGAALALTWGLVGAVGAVASALAAALGIIAGEMVGRSALKLGVAIGAAVVGGAAFWLLASVLTGTELVASWLGPGETLTLAVVVRFFAMAFWPVYGLRVLAVRWPAVVAIEVVAVTVAIAVLFAAHRGGIISRPFWLSDWAWRAGIDPTMVLLAIGGITVGVLTLMMVAETGRRITWMSALALPVAVLLVMTFLDVSGLPKPKPDSELGLTDKVERDTATPANTPPTPSGTGSTPDPKPSPSSMPSGQSSASPVPSGAAPEDGEDGGEQPQPKPQPKPGPPDSEEGESEDNKSAPLAVVLLGDDYAPPAQSFYFRQEALSEYNGARLVAATRSGVDRDVLVEFPTQKTTVEAPPAADRQRVRADVALLVEHTQPFGLESPVLFEPRPNPNPGRFVRAYYVESLAQSAAYDELLGRKAGDPAWTDEVSAHYLAPASDARFAELAREIVETLPAERRDDPFLQALAIKTWMDKNLVYSTRERHAGVPDPTADFLFGNRIGYCVHFAHAAVFMWRSLNIPSRAATGYMVSADNREGSSLLIRSGDAHAWPELYLEGFGWLVLDIAAERNIDPKVPPPDKELQRKLSELARSKPPSLRDARDAEKQPFHLPNLWLTLGVLAAATLLTLYTIKVWRRLAFFFAGTRAMTRVGYRLALDLLAEVGLTREYGEPREQFARRVHALVPSFTELTRMHQAARWGDPVVPIESRPEFSREAWKRALSQLREERKRVAPTPKRVLHWLNPASFVGSR